MVYNCLDRIGASRTSCQASLAQPYQQKGMLQDAMKAASGRLDQIKSLMNQIDSTADQKAVLEIQARQCRVIDLDVDFDLFRQPVALQEGRAGALLARDAQHAVLQAGHEPPA